MARTLLFIGLHWWSWAKVRWCWEDKNSKKTRIFL